MGCVASVTENGQGQVWPPASGGGGSGGTIIVNGGGGLIEIDLIADLPAIQIPGIQYLVREDGKIYWWDDTANGGAGAWVATEAAPHPVDELTDADTTTNVPVGPAAPASNGSQQGSVLIFDGTDWVPQEFSYRHIQGSAAAVWTINHNLGRRAAGVYVENSFGEECVADIVQVDDNQLTVTFAAAESGKAYVS